MKNGVIFSKLSIIENYLIKLEQYLPVSLADFKNNWGLQKIAERSLQVMIEIMIDVSERIIARNNITPQKTSAETISKLQDIGIIKNSEKYVKMIRFRNLVVHNYDSIDEGILYSILINDLKDFKTFIEEIKRHEKI